MSYIATVFNVMIASPSDVASERAIIRETIHEWNAVNSNIRKIVLLPIGWETHSSPEMGNSPQEIINQQVLNKCDLLVGVFWTRLGSPTKEHTSGTVEEIEKHIASNKPAMLYFSNQPVALDTVDMEQFEKLRDFKKSCQSRGLYQGYETHANFKENFYRHLQLKVNEHPLFAVSETENIEKLIVESQTKIPPLSAEARVILKNASQDEGGNIIFISGRTIQTNGLNLIPSEKPREVARWEAAIEQLEEEELIKRLNYKGEVFAITNLGYEIADMIEL